MSLPRAKRFLKPNVSRKGWLTAHVIHVSGGTKTGVSNRRPRCAGSSAKLHETAWLPARLLLLQSRGPRDRGPLLLLRGDELREILRCAGRGLGADLGEAGAHHIGAQAGGDRAVEFDDDVLGCR